MLEYKPIKFSTDELPHRNIIEWWYFNGHLVDQRGNRYAFMDCLFKANPKKVKIPFLSLAPLKEVYFSHTLLSEINKNKFHSEINPLVFLSRDSFTKNLFFANYTSPSLEGYFNYEMEKINQGHWRIKTPYFDLVLKNKKPPLLVAGRGFLDLGQNSTYYYSYTDLEATGEVMIDGHRIEVTGQSWMDHQWADAAYSDFKWSWFSLQLKNKTDLVCFKFEKNNQVTNLASIISNQGSQKSYSDVEFNNLDQDWSSPDTGTVYPLVWQIKIPSAEIDLRVEPLVKEQEMIFGPINYWEGGLSVSGRWGSEEITGQGFMELVGYKSQKNRLNYYHRLIQRQLRASLKKFSFFQG